MEDSAGVIALVRRTLEAEGFTVEVATGGHEGLERASAGGHVAVIVEVSVPGLSGLEVCRRFRERERSTPVLVLSAVDAEEDRLLAFDHGADAYLAKPFAPSVLRARLSVLLAHPLRDDPTAATSEETR